MSEFLHSEQCLGIQAEVAAKQLAYDEQWPSHCTECDGWGGSVGFYDPSPAGVSLGGGYFTEFEPCPHCYEMGHCPRCGGEMPEDQDLFESDTPCVHCGFKEGDEGRLDNPECGCVEEYMAKQFENWKRLEQIAEAKRYPAIHCCHCDKLLRDESGTDLVEGIYSNEDGEDICATCYATDVAPFIIWSEDGEEVIGYDFSNVVSENIFAMAGGAS